MPRYKLTIEFDGTPFIGWQVQAQGDSVQGALAQAVKNFSGDDFVPKAAGRTDSGVHALGMVAHVDLSKVWDPLKVREALNYHLKKYPIAILKCEAVSEEFDARFSATARHYLYRIINRRPRLTLEKNRAWHVSRELDVPAMHKAAQILVGEHDFTTFRSAHCQAKSPVKTLDSLVVIRAGEEIMVETSARSFMHHQVRSMVGSLKHVGEGKWTGDDLKGALEAKKRARCGEIAPACGLYFVGADYPSQNSIEAVYE